MVRFRYQKESDVPILSSRHIAVIHGYEHVQQILSKERLETYITTFFETYELKTALAEYELVVRFSSQRRYHDIFCNGYMYCLGSILNIVIYVDYPRRPRDLLTTFFHELDHAAWKLEGRKFDFAVEYYEREHEVRARKTADLWIKRITSWRKKTRRNLKRHRLLFKPRPYLIAS